MPSDMSTSKLADTSDAVAATATVLKSSMRTGTWLVAETDSTSGKRTRLDGECGRDRELGSVQDVVGAELVRHSL